VRRLSPALFLALLSIPRAASAGDQSADPSTYQAALAALQPGDTLRLAAGTYPLLVVSHLAGTAAAPVTIEGDAAGGTVIEGDPSHNTVEIVESSYVTLRALTVDSKGIDGVFGVSAKDGLGNHVHHITVEGCTFVGQGGGQQTVAISTKTPTWGWVLRGNVIDGAGTGLYLGNSDGSYPFVGGIIEGNLIKNTIGYNAQIKWQAPWPSGVALPAGPNRTIIRDNVFLKNDQPSPDGDRPNLLIGGSPTSGPGAQDLYEIYGNLFVHNPREALLQVAGRVTIHDNVFVDAASPAIVAQDHDLPLALARVYDNTIYTAGTGVHFGSQAPEGDLVAGNLIFAATPVDGQVKNQRDNLSDTVANAASYVKEPSMTLGAMDFYPLPGKATGTAVDLAPAKDDTAYDRDFNGTSKGGFTYRGAYAGEGTNPGWPLGDGRKTAGSGGTGGSGGSGGGGGGAGPGGGGSGGENAGGGGGGGNGSAKGCGCEAAGSGGDGWAAALGLGLAWAARRRKRVA
jgi:MYXO-CTERM domain-containing protein